MGKLTYDSSITVEFDDRVLAHIQLVVGAKLRRGEAFYFSWRDDPPVGGGRSTVWMHPGISLAYKYFGSKAPVLNRDWVEALSLSANSATGLQVMVEPAQRTPLALRPDSEPHVCPGCFKGAELGRAGHRLPRWRRARPRLGPGGGRRCS